MNSRQSFDLQLNLYEKAPKNQEWLHKQQNIEQIIQKIKERNLLKQQHIFQEQTQENDPFLKKSQRFNKKLDEIDHIYDEQLETYRKNLQSEREQLQNTISQRRRQGSFVKHVRSISTTVLKPLIQYNNIVNTQQNEKSTLMRQNIRSIQENRQTLENCTKRLIKLFQEDVSAQVSRTQSRVEQRVKRKKTTFDLVRHVY